jgi:hypothetical protein
MHALAAGIVSTRRYAPEREARCCLSRRAPQSIDAFVCRDGALIRRGVLIQYGRVGGLITAAMNSTADEHEYAQGAVTHVTSLIRDLFQDP